MGEQGKSAPRTNEERQAIATVLSIRDIYGALVKLANIIKDADQPLVRRNDAKHELDQASERLCNLMSLSAYQLDQLNKGEVHAQLTQELDEFRSRLVGLGAKLVVEKLEKLDKRAEEVLKDSNYPIGLSGKLEIAFANLKDNMGVLGGPERLGEDVPDLVAKTETDIKSLNEMEKNIGALADIQAPKSRRR